MAENNRQKWLFKGIYEFDDPTGSVIAARIPQHQSADLFDNTVIVVRPNQCVVFVYKGKIADVLGPGTHTISTENTPLLTQIAHWKYGFRSSIRCELWFFSGSLFLSRRWGTHQPVLHSFKEGNIQVRAFGNYSFRITQPKQLLLKIIGNRTSLVVSEIEDWIQGHIVQNFSEMLSDVESVAELGIKTRSVSERLKSSLQKNLSPLGIAVTEIQVLSLLPPKEIIQALDSQAAMRLLGSKQEYLLYKAANSLDAVHESGSNDPLQLMMGMMLGKSVIGADSKTKEPRGLSISNPQAIVCSSCDSTNSSDHRFCGHCGKELKA